jgi:hypothetical protein
VRAERLPVGVGRGREAVPVILEAGGHRLHLFVERPVRLDCAQVISIGFVLLQPHYFAIVQLAQKRYVAFANRRSKVAGESELFGFRQQVSGAFIPTELLAKHYACATLLRLTLSPLAPQKARQKSPGDVKDDGQR